jgi:hypothetical protein
MENLTEITNKRLTSWEDKCNQRNCTPMALLMLNPVTSAIEVITIEDISDSALKLILNSVANSI